MVKAAAGLVVLGTLCAGAALGIGIYKGITFAKQHTDDLDGAVKDAKEKAADKFTEGINKATEALEKSADALKEWVAKQGGCNDGFGSGFGSIRDSWIHGDAFDPDEEFDTSDDFGSSDAFGSTDAFDIPEGETISDEEYERLERGESVTMQAHHDDPFAFEEGTTFDEDAVHSDFPDGECCDDCKNNGCCDGTSCTPEPEDDAELSIVDGADDEDELVETADPEIPAADAGFNPNPFG